MTKTETETETEAETKSQTEAPAKRKRRRKSKTPPIVGKRIVNLLTASRYAGVSRWTLNDWIDTRKLPCLRYPGKRRAIRRVDLDDLDAFIRKYRDRNA